MDDSHLFLIVKCDQMDIPSNTFPEIGWLKERFQVLEINDDIVKFECLMSGKVVVPPHLHKDCDEEFTAIEGILNIKVGKNVYHLEPHNRIKVPKGEVHTLKNPSKETIRFKVSMKPNNVMSSLFEIMIFLQKKYPEKNYSIIAAMYILKKLKLKSFSTPVGINYFVESLGIGIAFLVAPIFGWSRLAKEFSESKLE